MGARPSGGGGGRNTIFNHGIDLQLRIMERLGDMTRGTRSENFRIPLAADGRVLSKGDCVRSCTHSNATVRGRNQDLVIRYIRVARESMDPSWKRKFDGGGDQGSPGVHWDRSRGHGPINSEGQHHGNGVRFSGGRGGHSGGRHDNNGGGGGA